MFSDNNQNEQSSMPSSIRQLSAPIQIGHFTDNTTKNEQSIFGLKKEDITVSLYFNSKTATFSNLF